MNSGVFFSYFIFRIILFRKNILLLLLYPKHVIKLSWHILGCYIILDDEFVTSRDCGFCRFLVKWHGRSDSDATWI